VNIYRSIVLRIDQRDELVNKLFTAAYL